MSATPDLKTRCLGRLWRLTPTCTEMARLSSQALDASLPWTTRLRMRLHFVTCVWCRRYFDQLRGLHHIAPHFAETIEDTAPRGLSAEARQRIKSRLKSAGRD